MLEGEEFEEFAVRLTNIHQLEDILEKTRLRAIERAEPQPNLPPALIILLSNVLNCENKLIIFKFCRWATSFASENQGCVWTHFKDSFVQTLKNETDSDTRNVALQVLANICVGNPKNTEAFLAELGLGFVLDYVKLSNSEPKVSSTASMLGLILTQVKPDIVMSQFLIEYLRVILDSEHHNNDLWLERMFQEPNFIRTYFPDLESDHRVKLLQSICDNNRCHKDMLLENISYFTELFSSMSDTIMNSTGDVLPEVLMSLVVLFTKLALVHQQTLQAERKLVTAVTLLLRGVHDAGRASQNQFTPVHNISQMRNSELEFTPINALKADLMRILGALVENHKENQDKVYDLGALRVVLECTKPDARNLWLPQYSILALKFLLHNNPRNQAFVSELSRVGTGFQPVEL